ncbi:cell division control protein 42 homolog [Saccoglossus kowalevskii]
MLIQKCVMVGDSDSDRTNLFLSYTKDKCISRSMATLFENYAVNVVVNNGRCHIELQIYDTADPGIIEMSDQDLDNIRQIEYPATDVILVCFSVVSPSSFESVKYKWIPEIKKHCPRTHFMLVGTQVELREDAATVEKLQQNKMKPITAEEAKALAEASHAYKYVECSVSTQEGVKNVFDEAALSAFEALPPLPENKCEVM